MQNRTSVVRPDRHGHDGRKSGHRRAPLIGGRHAWPMQHQDNRRTRHVAVLVFDGVRTLDVTGPLEVFDVARSLGCDYTVALYSTADSVSVECSSGLRFSTIPA